MKKFGLLIALLVMTASSANAGQGYVGNGTIMAIHQHYNGVVMAGMGHTK